MRLLGEVEIQLVAYLGRLLEWLASADCYRVLAQGRVQWLHVGDRGDLSKGPSCHHHTPFTYTICQSYRDIYYEITPDLKGASFDEREGPVNVLHYFIKTSRSLDFKV